MILYDKECNLLGMSKSILDFLGYEDIEEFKTYTNDVADLFQDRSGYIHRFKNFSWINYILHSGAPNKNAILLLKNGKEAEVQIVINEIISLENSIDKIYYIVNLQPAYGNTNNTIIKTPSTKPIDKISQETSFILEEEPLPKETKGSFFENTDDHDLPSEEELSFKLNEKSEDEDTKIHFEEPDKEIHLKIEPEVTFNTEQDSTIFGTQDETTPSNIGQDLAPYDFELALSELEIEPEELEVFLQEYCDHAEMVAIAIEDSMRQNDTIVKEALLSQLKGISEHLRIGQVAKLLNELYKSDDIAILNDLQEYIKFLKSTHIKH